MNKVNGKILIVDDDATSLRILYNMVIADDYNVVFAESGQQALEMIRAEKPDLILLDVVMPGMDGYTVIRRLKGDSETQDIPVIFTTGNTGQKHVEEGLDLGAADYIEKPYSPTIVSKKVSVHMENAMLQKQLAAQNRQLAEQNRKLSEQNRQLAEQIKINSLDGLTGINNRRAFDIHVRDEWERAIRGKTSISILIIDIDYFKKYNDMYGHQQGDEALKRVARILSEAVRRPFDRVARLEKENPEVDKNAQAARYGGEEFAVVLPITNIMGACTIAGKIRQTVAEAVIPYGDEDTSVTVSIGVCSANPVMCDSMNQFIKNADDALYRAKEAGRNTVESHDQSTENVLVKAMVPTHEANRGRA